MKTSSFTKSIGGGLLLGALAFASGALVPEAAQAHPCPHPECGGGDVYQTSYWRECYPSSYYPGGYVDVYFHYYYQCGDMPAAGNCACYGESCTNYCTGNLNCFAYSWEQWDNSACP
jgi:hypothetical protein